MKKIKIIDEYSGEVELDIELPNGHFYLQYIKSTDNGFIHRYGKLINGRFGDKHWIKNYYFEPIAEKLVEKFEEIKHVHPGGILFLENTAWTPGKGVAKKDWIARISKPNAYFQAAWGYYFIIEIKAYYVERLSKEQLIAVLYHELRHIDRDYELRPHDIEDWDNMVATFGKNWVDKNASMINILDEEFKGWYQLRRSDGQVSMFDESMDAKDNVTSISRASKNSK